MLEKTYRVALGYSGYIEVDDIKARSEAEAITKAVAIVSDVSYSTPLTPGDLERWPDSDMAEEVI